MFTGSRSKMEGFVNPGWMKSLAWLISLIIISLNVYLLYQTLI